jgi:hypothetical protein
MLMSMLVLVLVLMLMLMLMLMSMAEYVDPLRPLAQPRLPSLVWPPKVTSPPLSPATSTLPRTTTPRRTTPHHLTPQPVADLTRPLAARTCFSPDRPPPPPHDSLPMPDVAAHHRSLHCTLCL